MQNIALRLSFNGTRYHGWQIQKNTHTVCGTVTVALEKTLGHPVILHGCGRTDAGVHAKTYLSNFKSDTRIPVDRLPYAVNSRLPPDIAITSAALVSDEFNAISCCTGKEYTYYLYQSAHDDPFLYQRALRYPYPLNVPKMQEAAKIFTGKHDFSCVRTQGSPVKSTVRTLFEFEISRTENSMTAFRMRADGFLYNMARTLMGTMLYVNEGKINDIAALIASGERSRAGPVVPAYGLYMTAADYNELGV
ncbi:MAG: tRNA pseudouridine(38-40) synthase TruA [Oscillospiraceae bacterium]|nr:tRNA pseudouridine(38-40) synthase TruA [Oscillospiraceae bacterium]